MGACATEEKAKPTKRQLDADLERIQKSNRADTIARSEPIELLCISPVQCTLQCYEAQTALEVLEMLAPEIGLPVWAAPRLKMQFAGAIVAHQNTMREAGLCDKAEFSGVGGDQARAQLK